jgi:Tyrosine phosphatase family
MKPSLMQLLILLAAPMIIAQAESYSGNLQHTHPAPGTSIVRFGEVDKGVYKGSKPKNDADYRFLKSKNVKYILDLKFFPLLYRLERKKAERYDMIVIPVTINASPLAPSKEHVREILCILADKRLRPIYFHCSVGRDRTSLIATLYEIYFKGLPPEGALDEMKGLGFKDDWTLAGLKTSYSTTQPRSLWTPLRTAGDRCRSCLNKHASPNRNWSAGRSLQALGLG